MAIMIPMELKEGDYLSEGEKEVFENLKLGLSDEWLVVYALRWITNEDVHLNKSNGESDFILLHRKYGVMILEVKGGIISCINGEWSSISNSNTKSIIKDPEKQVSDAKYNLITKLKKDNINAYVTTAVWFPDCISKNCSLPLSMPKEIILDMHSFNNIEERIVEIFAYRHSKEGFTPYEMLESDYNKVVSILNPKVEIKMPLLRLTNKLNMKFLKLNDEQNHFFESIEDNKFIAVSGHAGTGKTVLAVKKAFRDSNKGKKVLLLCYNNLLKQKLIEESEDEFKVYNIHSLASEYLKIHNEDLYNLFNENANYEEMMSNFLKELENNKDNHKLTFDSIIIDEGQDFIEEWFNGVYKLLNKDGHICIFYDENQRVYDTYGRWNIDFLKKGTTYKLKTNMRNTDEICISSLNVINADKSSIRLNGVVGVTPDIVFLENSLQSIEVLKRTIKELKKNEYLNDDNIVVLTIEARNKPRFMKGVKDSFTGPVESIRRFKGLESDVIIIPDLNHNFLENDEQRRLLYVGMSRAKAHVILIINTEELNRKQRVDYKKNLKDIIVT